MEVINYFSATDKNHWLGEIEKCAWWDAKFLLILLKKNAFHQILGEGSLYLLINDNQLLSFGTLTQNDCIRAKGLHPWIGFIFTLPEHRGKRYSEILINQLLFEAAIQGYSFAYLATEHIGLYEKYGFTYIENRMDAWGINNRIYYKHTNQQIVDK